MKKNKRVPALPGRQAGGRQAVVLLSGGLDSATCLYVAKESGYRCFCLIFDYGQRHRREIGSAKKISRKAGCPLQVLKISLPWKGSALLDKGLKLSRRDNETTRQRDNEKRDFLF
jgi:7-cyano-7-deazaguanine synthase